VAAPGLHAIRCLTVTICLQDFDKQVSQEPPTVDDIEPLLSPHVLRMYIDLKPYVNPASYVVQQSTCATQTYTLFQKLGLRHLCVVKDTDAVLGVVTRKDFMAPSVQSVISSRVQSELDEAGPARCSQGMRLTDGPMAAEFHSDGLSHDSRRPSWGADKRKQRPGQVGVVRTKGSP
jgi:hypothetical protein